MDTQIFTFRAIIEKDGKSYHGYVPSLPGCHTQGKTIDETRKHLREAIEGVLLVMKKHKEDFPTDDGIEILERIDVGKLFSSSAYA
jgi:predicted RNase H-like HicB family nuclease